MAFCRLLDEGMETMNRAGNDAKPTEDDRGKAGQAAENFSKERYPQANIASAKARGRALPERRSDIF